MIQEVKAGKKKRFSTPTLQASPQALTRVLEDKSPINPVLKLKFKAIFDRFETLVKLSSTQITTTKYRINRNSVFDPAPDFLRGEDVEHVRTFSPLELIASAILVAYNMDTRSDAEMLENVKEMRYHLRLMHKDLRVNAQCWLTVWEFIVELDQRRVLSSATPELVNFNANSFTRKVVNGSSAAAGPSKTTTDARLYCTPYPKLSPKRARDSDNGYHDSPKKKKKKAKY
jgi:hypothetical protein